MKNQYSLIDIRHRPHAVLGDELKAVFEPIPADNLRTAAGRRRLQRFVKRLQVIHDQYERQYETG